MGLKLYTVKIGKDYKIDFHWKEDVKNALLNSGGNRIYSAFVINDNQLIHDKMLEDINNLLNNGDIPNVIDVNDTEIINK